MKKYIESLPDLWDTLSNTAKPIVLYGMGNGADKIIDELNEHNIKLSGMFASDDFVRGQSFHGFTVCKYSDLLEKYNEMTVLVSFGTSRQEILDRIYSIADEQELYAPDVAVIGGGLFNKKYALENIDRINFIYSKLCDETSKNTFKSIISYKITGNISYLKNCESNDCPVQLNENEIFMDIGAYTGDTVEQFVNCVGGGYDKIYAIEPDSKNYSKLVKNTSHLDNIVHLNLCINDKCEKLGFCQNGGRNSGVGKSKTEIDANSIDNILQGAAATYIKMDVEGQEEKAINGAVYTIAKFKPKMKIAVYHRFNDIIKLPEKVLEINSDYSLFMRHCPYIPAWDTDFYFV